MLGIFKKKAIDPQLYAPVNGICTPLEQVKDPVFANKLMGDGVAFQLDGDTIYAPCNGNIMMIAATKHAIGIKADNGAEVLIHVGLDTVNLNGTGFTVQKEVKDNIVCGEVIMKIDRAYMEAQGMDLTTPMIITNGNEGDVKVIKQDGIVSEGKTAIMTYDK